MFQLVSLRFLSFRLFYLQLHPALGMEENGNGHENMLSSSLSNSLISVERYADLRSIFLSSSNSIFISIILLMYLVIQNILFCIKNFNIRHVRLTYYNISKIYLAYYALDQYRRLPQRMILLSRMEEYLLCKRTTTLLSICCHFSYLSNSHLY